MAVLPQLEPRIHSEMERWDVPGVAIGILHEGLAELGGYGIANMETGQPVVPETLFQIGSISKVFTATLVMTLVDEGMLDLDTPVITYVPNLPLADETARQTITLRHLLTHRGGFQGDRFDDHGQGDDALARAVAAFGDLAQQTAPGELWTYCNAGFDLAGRCVENVLGMPFERAMRERIFQPLGLERATYFAHEAILHSVAVGHEEEGEDGPRVATPWPIPRRSNPAGGVTTNVAELLRFAACHLRDGAIGDTRILQPDSARAMRTVQTPGDYNREWGLGWSIRTIDGVQLVEHAGATNGFMARLLTVPGRNLIIAILTNGDNGSALHGAVSSAALELLLGLKEPAREPVTLDEESLRRFAGSYASALADLTISLDDGHLRLERTTHDPFSGKTHHYDPVALAPLSETLIRIEEGPLQGGISELILNPDGSVRFLRTGGRLALPAG